MRERLQNMQRKKQVQDSAARQMEALRRRRAEREAAAKIEQGARFENMNTYFNSSTTMEITSTREGLSDEALLAEHETRWAAIESAATLNTSTSSPDVQIEQLILTYNTLPWPPFGEDLHRYLRALSNP